MYEDKLQRLGLSSGEARVYIALIELGASTVGPIVKSSKVAYSKIYEVLSRLIEKGLISFIIKEKTKYFQAVEPNRLKEYIAKKEKEVEENKLLLKDMLPLLENLSVKKSEHETEIFTGNKGILTAYEILLSSIPKNGQVRFFYVYNPEYGRQIFDFYFRSGMFFKVIEGFYKKNNIQWRGLINRKSAEPPKPIHSPPFMKQIEVSFPIPGNIDIGEDKILLTAWSSNPLAILIHSKEIAQNFKDYFDSFWSIYEATQKQLKSSEKAAGKIKK